MRHLIEYEVRGGMYYASCQTLDGFSAAGRTLAECIKNAGEKVMSLYRAGKLAHAEEPDDETFD